LADVVASGCRFGERKRLTWLYRFMFAGSDLPRVPNNLFNYLLHDIFLST
jgi:hypothetical protein